MIDDLIFVYGTLRRALRHPMHDLLARDADDLGDATAQGALIDLGVYPGARFDPDSSEIVIGEIYRLRNPTEILHALDRYEQCAPTDAPPREYTRKRILVRRANGETLTAWAYEYAGDTALAIPIPDGDYAAHARWRIRAELPADFPAIDRVNQLAFAQDAEARLVRALRSAPDHDSSRSLVAERDGEVLGHIFFSRVRIEHAGGATAALALAPMAVVPTCQRQGIGSRLVRVGMRVCRELGDRIVVVLGHPGYYPRFGFIPARPCGIESPFPVPDEAFMVCPLAPDALTGVRGVVRYSSAFDDVA